MLRICFVCLGNICRSPTAEAVFRHLVEEAGLGAAFTISSAGTGTWFEGEPPDPRAREAAARRGVEVGGVAHKIQPAEFDDWDLVIAMDRQNLADLRKMARTPKDLAKLRLLREFAGEEGAEVPDPFVGEGGFDEVFKICERACRALLDAVRESDSES